MNDINIINKYKNKNQKSTNIYVHLNISFFHYFLIYQFSISNIYFFSILNKKSLIYNYFYIDFINNY